MNLLNVAASTQRGLLFNNDCLDVLQNVMSNSVSTVFADPPFNLKKQYGNGRSDDLGPAKYLDWCRSWLHECVRIIRHGGSLFVYNLPKWNVSLAHYLILEERMNFRHWIAISLKASGARQKHLYPAHYSLLYLTKEEPAVFNRDSVRYSMPTCRHCGTPIPDWGGYKNRVHPLGVNLSDIWTDVSPVRHRSDKKRAWGLNELDPKIPERAILLTTNVGDMVVDPFGGGGSTYRMAEKHDRFWIGSEIGDCSAIVNGLSDMDEVSLKPGRPPQRILEVLKSRECCQASESPQPPTLFAAEFLFP